MHTIQILELLPGDGYLNGKIDPAMLKLRLEREDFWIKTLRSVYPYGLNERVKSMNKDIPAGRLFPSLGISAKMLFLVVWIPL